MQTDPEKDISIVLTSFFLKCAGFWLAADHNEQFRRNLALYYTVGAVIFAVCTESMDFYYSWGDFSFLKGGIILTISQEVVYVGCNMMTLLIVLYKIFILSFHRPKFINIILYTEKNFWRGYYDEQELKIMRQCKRRCVFFVCSFTCFALSTVCCYTMTPIIGNIGKNITERMLPFKIWVDIPYWKTPYYQTIFLVQALATFHVGICYFCFDNFLCILSIHTAGQFQMLQRDIRRVCDKADIRKTAYDEKSENPNFTVEKYNKLKRLTRQHQTLIDYVTNIEEIFTFIIFGQILIFSVLICLVGYQILLADGPATRRTIFIAHMSGTIIQLLMITFSCHGLIDESLGIADAVYESLWYTLPMDKAGKSFRRDIQSISMRSHQYCCVTGGGFFVVSIETFMTVLRTAMSYFTLLRQCTMDNPK